MKYFFDHWPRIARSLKGCQPVVFLDFDGTLSALAATPQEAVLAPEAKAALKKLSLSHQGRVAIVSGRSLKDLKKKVGLKELTYVGNHGLEINARQCRFMAPGAKKSLRAMREIKGLIRRQLKEVKGILLEDKSLTMSLHYRQVKAADVPLVKRVFNGIVRPYIIEKKVKVNTGKMVFEIKPPVDWDKGRAVVWLMRRIAKGKRTCPIYVGDDTTDEDAFAAIKRRGISIVVGRKHSKAAFFLKSQREIIRLLQCLAKLN